MEEEELPVDLKAEVNKFEGELIAKALRTADGSLTRAAGMLGMSHPALKYVLESRHRDLMPLRAEVRKRGGDVKNQ